MSTPAEYVVCPEALNCRDETATGLARVWLWRPGRSHAASVSTDFYARLASRAADAATLSAEALTSLAKAGVVLEREVARDVDEWTARARLCLEQGDGEHALALLERARHRAPDLVTPWFRSAFASLHLGERAAATRLFEEYFARDDHDRSTVGLASTLPATGAWAFDGDVAIVAETPAVAEAVGEAVRRLNRELGVLIPGVPAPVVLLRLTADAGGPPRCLVTGSPFVREIRIEESHIAETSLAHELTHARLFSTNVALAEGLAVWAAARVVTGTSKWQEEDDAARRDPAATERFCWDLQYQAERFREASLEWMRDPCRVPDAYRRAATWVDHLVARHGLPRVLEVMMWLRHPTPRWALDQQRRLFDALLPEVTLPPRCVMLS